jgi:hypothetical protein
MTEQASIKFLQWLPLYDHEKPFQIFMELSRDAKDQRKSNLAWDERSITVKNFRDNRDFQLDSHGFTSRKMSGFSELDNVDKIRKEFLPAVEGLLRKELEDVGTVFIFDWRVSRTLSTYWPSNTDNIRHSSSEPVLHSLHQTGSTSVTSVSPCCPAIMLTLTLAQYQ